MAVSKDEDGLRKALGMLVEAEVLYRRGTMPQAHYLFKHALIRDAAYEMLAAFFHLPAEVKQRYAAPASHGQTGYTGLLVETAAGAETADWKEMLNWGENLPAAHPLRGKHPHRFVEQGTQLYSAALARLERFAIFTENGAERNVLQLDSIAPKLRRPE